MNAPIRRAVGGSGLIFQTLNRRAFAYWGKVAVPERKSPSPVRIYLKRWQVEVCIDDTCYYVGVMAPIKPSELRHLKAA